MKARVYTRNAQKSVQRLLTNLDRRRDSESFGSFCRPYWHDKSMDFPSAHQQIGVLPLALFYKLDWPQNTHTYSDRLQDLINASLNYWAQIQYSNGSFSEHYPFEHSLGATAWTTWAVSETLRMIDFGPDLDESLRRAAEFMEQHDEPGDLANHQAVSASALVNVQDLLGREQTYNIEKRIRAIEGMQNKDGGFKEYEGPDIGYQSTTIAHLARVWQHNNNYVPDEVLRKALNFFSSFIDQHNYYAGIIGSRRTKHIHPTGFEILADEFEQAEKIANACRKNMSDGNLLMPGVMDDKHFSRQLTEFLLSFRDAKDGYNGLYPEIEDRDMEHISVRVENQKKTFINSSKGGVYKSYRKGKMISKNTGISTKIKGSVFTSNWPGSTTEASVQGGDIKVSGKLRKTPKGKMPGANFLACRAFNHTLGRVSEISMKIKDILISRLIRNSDKGPCFQRELTVNGGLVQDIEDRYPGKKVDGKTMSNFVPSSEFFTDEP